MSSLWQEGMKRWVGVLADNLINIGNALLFAQEPCFVQHHRHLIRRYR